jgi:hypothetical protein
MYPEVQAHVQVYDIDARYRNALRRKERQKTIDQSQKILKCFKYLSQGDKRRVASLTRKKYKEILLTYSNTTFKKRT